MNVNEIAREVELIFGFQPETCIPFPVEMLNVEDDMAGNEIVTVKNVGKRLALVNGAYVYPGETARVPHSAYEAAKASGHPVVLEIDEGTQGAHAPNAEDVSPSTPTATSTETLPTAANIAAEPKADGLGEEQSVSEKSKSSDKPKRNANK